MNTEQNGDHVQTMYCVALTMDSVEIERVSVVDREPRNALERNLVIPVEMGEQKTMYCLVSTMGRDPKDYVIWQTFRSSRSECYDRSLEHIHLMKNNMDRIADRSGHESLRVSWYKPSASRASRLAALRRNGYHVRRVQVKIVVEPERKILPVGVESPEESESNVFPPEWENHLS